MLRARNVMTLRRDIDLRIVELPAVRRFTGLDYFSGMAVLRGD